MNILLKEPKYYKYDKLLKYNVFVKNRGNEKYFFPLCVQSKKRDSKFFQIILQNLRKMFDKSEKVCYNTIKSIIWRLANMANKNKTTTAAESVKEAVKPVSEAAEVKSAPVATVTEPVKAPEVAAAAEKAAVEKPAKKPAAKTAKSTAKTASDKPAKAAAKTEKPAAKATKSAAKTEKATKTTKAAKAEKPAAKTTKSAKTTKAAGKAAKAAKATGDKVVLQFKGNEYDMAALSDKCKSDFKSKYPKKRISSLEVYIKPEEGKIFYVVNGSGGDDYSIDL